MSMNRTGNLNFKTTENKFQTTTMTSGFFNRTAPKFMRNPTDLNE